MGKLKLYFEKSGRGGIFMKYARYVVTFLMGYFLYALIEIFARGYTHWTMALTGGAVFTTLCILFQYAPPMPVQMLYFLGAVVITSYELAVGVIVNLRLHWNVWDYSTLPLNSAVSVLSRSLNPTADDVYIGVNASPLSWRIT